MKKIILPILICTAYFSLFGQGCAPKMPLLEMSCAKNCGPCTFHLDEVHHFYNTHRDDLAMVYYVQAPIGLGNWGESNMPYSAFYDIFNIDYQSSALMDRTFMPTNYDSQEGTDTEVMDNVEIAFNAQMASTYVPVSININHTYNPANRQVNVNLTGNFCDNASGDLRFYLVVVQDTVIGEGVDYAQNAFSESSANDLGFTDLINSGGALWINQYPHMQVVKYQPSGFFGNAGVIANTVSSGQSFTENYTFTLPEFGAVDCIVPVDPEHVEIIAAVVKFGGFDNRQVLNANKVKLSEVASTPELTNNSVSFEIVGNPITNGTIQLQFNSEKEITGDIILFNSVGQIVSTLESKVTINNTTEIKSYSIGNQSKGIYFIGFKSTIDNIQYTRKLIIE
ncbi:MAG: hypothetical protein ACK46Y_16430 [Fluviicola sp.]|jgi:hypothetical protein